MTADSPQDAGYRWPVPPPGGWTVEDLFTLPDLPPHTELLDGSLIFVSPQRDTHSVMIDLLVAGLRDSTPRRFRVRREMTVILDGANGPEPDVTVVRADAVSREKTRYAATDVVLAVEVISPESRLRDEQYKPRKYAASGIPHFWLVEMPPDDTHPVVRTYELDPVTGAYALTGIHHKRLQVSAPFDIDLDITWDAVDSL
ncbi:Uma2 family endonuclease [Streptomyces sp. NRRL F-5630]|nr:Uma2 family endonuclease [Streptomyces sp. NRRL F-5630]